MKQGQLDITFARVARDQGMRQAQEHADEEKHGWSNDAYAMLLKYLLSHDEPFMTEQVREYSYALGLVSPPSERAWGSIITRAVKAGLVVGVGYGQVSNVNAHMANAKIWKKSYNPLT